ncbi:hypothetical protein Tco_0650538 [Tanacetum coccineum]
MRTSTFMEFKRAGGWVGGLMGLLLLWGGWGGLLHLLALLLPNPDSDWGIVYSSVIISYPGLPSGSIHCLAPVPRQNIVVLRMLLLQQRGFEIYIFTKGLPSALFLEFRSSLNVQRLPAQTTGEY